MELMFIKIRRTFFPFLPDRVQLNRCHRKCCMSGNKTKIVFLGAGSISFGMSMLRRILDSGIVYNQRAIPNLPGDLAVEVPIVVDAAGVHPISMGALPDPIAKLMSMQASVQQLAVDAAVLASKEIALQALLIDPVVNSGEAAEELLDELWEMNRPYIRKCI